MDGGLYIYDEESAIFVLLDFYNVFHKWKKTVFMFLRTITVTANSNKCICVDTTNTINEWSNELIKQIRHFS